MNFIEIDGYRLRYTFEGRGEPVLVIGSAVYYSRTFSSHLREKCQLVFVDHRGFAEPMTRDLSILPTFDILLDDIERVRQDLSLDRVTILGHSGHGYLALEYAKKYPRSVSRVALIAMSPDSSLKSFAAADIYLKESVCPIRKRLLEQNLVSMNDAVDQDPDRAFITRMLMYGPLLWFDPSYDATSLWDGVSINSAIVNYLWGDVFRRLDITIGLSAMTLPVYVALGRYDYFNPPWLWEAVRDKFHHLTLRVFEQSGHTPQMEEADPFDDEFIKWMEHSLSCF